jgi:glutamate racemase
VDKHSQAPIGIFDSGVGGLVVMQQLIKNLPQESCIYFADTGRLPYGDKSRDTIIRYSIENSIFLLEKKIKLLVVACNTATAHAAETLTQIFKIPVIGAIEPGAKRALEKSASGRIAVLGTKGTIRSECYQRAILKQDPSAYVLPIACPLFVPLVEEHYFTHPATRLIAQEYLSALKKERIDTLLLGCTHYPLLIDLIKELVGGQVQIVDSATSCADAVAEILDKQQLKAHGNAPPMHRYYVSDDPTSFQQRGELFLGLRIPQVEKKSD